MFDLAEYLIHSLIIEENNEKDIPQSKTEDLLVFEGKPKRKSAIKAATTFSQFAEDEIDAKVKRSIANCAAKNDLTRDEDLATDDDDDFQVSDGEYRPHSHPTSLPNASAQNSSAVRSASLS